jgi:hypothetical protein
VRKALRVLLALTIGVATMAAQSDAPITSARRLTDALLHSKLERVPAGLSPPATTRMPSTAHDWTAGVVGAVRMSFPGRESNAEIRYAVFANPDDARKYSANFGRGLAASHQQRIVFSNLPAADCAQRGQTQLCAAVNGNVFALAITNGAANLNSPAGQGKGGVSAGIVAQFALAHIENARKSIASPVAAKPMPTARASGAHH